MVSFAVGRARRAEGVLRADDARRARDTGYDAVWVTSRPRQLRRGARRARASSYRSIRRALGDEAEIIYDGGVMRGVDVVKAIARGATAVGVGKAYLYGPPRAAFEGVERAFDFLTQRGEARHGVDWREKRRRIARARRRRRARTAAMTPIPTALSGGSRVILPFRHRAPRHLFLSIRRRIGHHRHIVETSSSMNDMCDTRSVDRRVVFFSFSFLESYLADFEIVSLPPTTRRTAHGRLKKRYFRDVSFQPNACMGDNTQDNTKGRGRQSRARTRCRCARVRRRTKRTKRTKRTCERCARERWMRTNRRAADARAGGSDAAGHVSEATASSPRVEGRSWRSRWRR